MESSFRKHRRMLHLATILCMSWLFYSLDGAVIQVLITNANFNETFHINPSRLGLFSFFPSIGALIGQCGVGAALCRTFGRKWTFQIATSLVVFGVILQTFTNKWPAVLVGRVIMGVGGDTNGLNLGYYVTEAAPKEIRGRALIFVQQFSSSFFAIAGSWISYGLTFLPQDKSYSWKIANSLQFVPAAIFFALVFYLPESPRWLALKHPEDDGPMLKSLAKIRDRPATDPDIINEAKEIRDYNTWHLRNKAIAWWKPFTQGRFLKRMAYAFVPLLGIQFTGVGLLSIYASLIYESLGLNTQHNALLLNACLQIAYAGAALGSVYVVEKLGRRPCTVWGMLINTVGLACIVGLAVGYEGSTNRVADGFVVFFIAAMNFNYWLLLTGPTVVYVNEIMPTQGREIGVSFSNLIPIGCGIALGQKWPLASARLGAKSYCILLSTSAVAFILNYIFVKEPKGMSIEKIDVLFGENDHVEEVQHDYALDKVQTADMVRQAEVIEEITKS